jgi:histidyl-tRNA synthetase
MLVVEPALPRVQGAVVAVGPEAESGALGLLNGLRRAGISAEQGWRGNLKKKMERAGKSGARLAVLIGADEVAAGIVTVRDLGSGEQVPVATSEALAAIVARLSGGGLKG